MNKHFTTTSKKEYKTPNISVNELKKCDVLLASDEENRAVQANDVDNFTDLFSSMFQ